MKDLLLKTCSDDKLKELWENKMTEQTYKIDGMNCQHCVKAVEVELEEIGVDSFEVKIGSAKVKFDEDKITDADINKAVDEVGFKLV